MSGVSLCRRMLKIFKKISVSQSTRIAMKRIEMQKKNFPLGVMFPFAAECSNFNTINRT